MLSLHFRAMHEKLNDWLNGNEKFNHVCKASHIKLAYRHITSD